MPIACVLSVGCAFRSPSLLRCDAPDAAVSPTPREEDALERFALDVDRIRADLRRRDRPLFASDATYARIVRDVHAVRAAIPDVADVTHAAFDDGHVMGFILSRDAIARYHAGTFDDLDCVLDRYDGAVEGVLGDREDTLLVRFAGVYDLSQIYEYAARRVGSVHGSVQGLFPGPGSGGGPTICVDGTDDDVWHYVFVDTNGACDTPCTEATSYYVTTTADGGVQVRDEYVEARTGPVPAFVRTYRIPRFCGPGSELEGLRR